jgi:hypothetical protein
MKMEVINGCFGGKALLVVEMKNTNTRITNNYFLNILFYVFLVYKCFGRTGFLFMYRDFNLCTGSVFMKMEVINGCFGGKAFLP